MRLLLCRVIVIILLAIPTIVIPGQEALNGIIRYGLVEDFPPYTFVDDEGEPTGFLIERYTRIMSEYDYEPDFVVTPWELLYGPLLINEVDMFLPILRIPERENLVHWSEEPSIPISDRDL